MKPIFYNFGKLKIKAMLDGTLKEAKLNLQTKLFHRITELHATHFVLSKDKMIEIKKDFRFETSTNDYHHGVHEYVIFTLGEVVDYHKYDRRANNRKQIDLPSVKCLETLKLRGFTFTSGTIYQYKKSLYQTKQGNRYLIFFKNNFEAGFDETDFNKYFEVV